MTRARIGTAILAFLATTLFLSTCDQSVNSGFEDTIELFAGLEPIKGASNSTMIVSRGDGSGSNSFFQVEITGIETNSFLRLGTHGAWCLEWKKSLRSNNDVHNGVKWYATTGNDKWKPLNYFFSIKRDLEAADPDITFREMQAVVWSLAGFMGIAPEFNVDKLADSELPRRLTIDGKPNFSKQKVKAIVTRIKSEYPSFRAKSSVESGCILGETAPDQQDVCVPIEPVEGVSELCQEGSFAPKGALNLGISIDMSDAVAGSIVNSFTSIGLSPRVYTDREIENRIPELEGANVLVISRKVTLNPVSDAYVEGVKSFIRSGGSIIAEYDGAGMLFSDYLGDDAVLANMNPSLNLFTGTVNGGGVLFPEFDSVTRIIEPDHLLVAGLPSQFINGFRRAYVLTNYNEEWLTPIAEYISSGNFGFPEGTYPAVLGGRCGSGRIAIFTKNYFNAMTQNPIDRMTLNAINWALGIE